MKTNKKGFNTNDGFINYINKNSDFYDKQQISGESIELPETAKDKYLLGNLGNQAPLSKLASLKFYSDSGEVEYKSKLNTTYQCEFKQNTDAFILLQYLLDNRYKYCLYSDIAEEFENKNIEDPEKKVRSAVSYIKKKLKIKKKEDEFIVCSNKRFSLKKDVEIIE